MWPALTLTHTLPLPQAVYVDLYCPYITWLGQVHQRGREKLTATPGDDLLKVGAVDRELWGCSCTNSLTVACTVMAASGKHARVQLVYWRQVMGILTWSARTYLLCGLLEEAEGICIQLSIPSLCRDCHCETLSCLASQR